MIDLDTLTEAYTILKQYVPAKDRQEAADNLMSVMVDFLSDQDLKEFGAIDSYLIKAYKEYSYEEYDDTDESDE